MYKNRVGILGSPESIADDIVNLMLTDLSLEGRITSILNSTTNDLYAMQDLVEAISKYSCGVGDQDSIKRAFNVYRSNLHLARIE